jgi:pilus assembly protein CpaB
VKRISPATVTMGLIAILCGLGAAYMARHALSNKTDGRVEIVVAAVNLPKFSRIGEDHVRVIKVEADQVPEGALLAQSRAVARVTRTTVLAGQPLVDASLYGVGEMPTLSEQLPAGFRAVTIEVESSRALGGVLVPESIVDVLLTVGNEQEALGGGRTLTLVESVKVLATDQQRFKAEERLGQNLRSVTIAVRPREANKLVLAQRHGTLSLALRSSAGDDQVALNTQNSIDLRTLLGLENIPNRRHKVQIWRGTSMTEVEFSGREVQEARAATAATDPTRRFRAVSTQVSAN